MRLTQIFILILISNLFIANAAQAHVLLESDSLGIVMHIDPDDDPIVNQPATFYLSFKDKQDRFSLDKCVCQLMIQKEGQQIFSQVVLATDGTNSRPRAFIFSEKGIYNIILDGQPNSEGDFNKFHIDYPLRVERQAPISVSSSDSKLPPHFWHVLLFGLPFVYFFGLAIRDKIRRKNQPSPLQVTHIKALFAALILTGFIAAPVHAASAACHSSLLAGAKSPACCPAASSERNKISKKGLA